jgi:hypothetical protein
LLCKNEPQTTRIVPLNASCLKFVSILKFNSEISILFLNILCHFIFRKQKKENWPISEKLEVPPHKRAKFLGLGGSNLKRLLVETGVQVVGYFCIV